MNIPIIAAIILYISETIRFLITILLLPKYNIAMNIINEFHDDQYPKIGEWKERGIARAIVINEEGLFAIHKISRDDIFGRYQYYETPGGGIDEGETPEVAVARECEEELGYKVQILDEIGIIKDEYALLGRININYYFLAKTVEKTSKHFVSTGDSLIDKTLYLPLNEIISLYEGTPNKDIPLLLKRRELPIWKEAKNKLLNKKDTLLLDKDVKLY